MEKVEIKPSNSRDSGIYAIPARSESRTVEPKISFPSSLIEPDLCFSKFTIALASSDCPLP